MINTIGEIASEVLVRNNLTTTDGFITDQILKDWTKTAYTWGAGYKKWPMTEGRVSTTFASLVTSEDGYLVGEYPEGWKADSIRLLTIGGKRVDKKNFYKFQQFLEDNASATERIFSDYNRRYYVNPNIDLSGTITMWGQYTPIYDASLPASTTVFSDAGDEGNEAIVEKITSYLKMRQKKQKDADAHELKASAKLDELYERVKEEQAMYQDTDNDGMFKRMDIVNGGFRDDIINENQFN